MEVIKVMQFALCLLGVLLSGMLFQISLPFIKNWLKNKFGKPKKGLPDYENKPTAPKQSHDILKAIEIYNQINDDSLYEYIQLVAKAEKFKKAIKILDEQIKQIEKQVPFKTTKGGNYEIN